MMRFVPQRILRPYQRLTTNDARRDFLQDRMNSLQTTGFEDCFPFPYWQNIGKELALHWVKRLQNEIQQAREWLRLDINLTQEQLPLVLK